MKKKVIAIVAALLLTVGTAFSQVILTDEDFNNNRAQQDINEIGVMVPRQNVAMDQYKYVPLGNGVLLLAGLGAAYLVRKRNEEYPSVAACMPPRSKICNQLFFCVFRMAPSDDRAMLFHENSSQPIHFLRFIFNFVPLKNDTN